MLWKRCLATTCFAIAVLLPLRISGQSVDTIDPALRAQIDRIAAGVMQQRGVPSASVAVVKGGKLVYTHAYGKAHMDPDTPATPDMRYSMLNPPRAWGTPKSITTRRLIANAVNCSPEIPAALAPPASR